MNITDPEILSLVALGVAVLALLVAVAAFARAGGRVSDSARSVVVSPASVSSPAVPVLSARVRDALARGRKVEAIKLLREETGLGLRDAKQAVEDAERGTLL